VGGGVDGLEVELDELDEFVDLAEGEDVSVFSVS
jgi:hypothetical protein